MHVCWRQHQISLLFSAAERSELVALRKHPQAAVYVVPAAREQTTNMNHPNHLAHGDYELSRTAGQHDTAQGPLASKRQRVGRSGWVDADRGSPLQPVHTSGELKLR